MVGVVVGCSDELFLTATLNRSVFLQVVLVNAPFVCHAPHACHGGVSMPNMASWHAGLCYPVACAACSWRIGWSRASLAHYRRARSLSHTARCGQHTLGTGSTTTRCGVQVGAVLAEVLQAHFSGRIDRRGCMLKRTHTHPHTHARAHTHTHTHTYTHTHTHTGAAHRRRCAVALEPNSFCSSRTCKMPRVRNSSRMGME